MSDQVQTESGADVNALRNNLTVGETQELTIAGSHQISADIYVISAWTKEDKTDVDTDVCKITTEGWHPSKGEVGAFTRTEAGDLEVAFVS